MAPILSLGSYIIIKFIRFYQFTISPIYAPHCRFQPTCSHYAIKVIYRFGIIKSSWLILKRILKCHPLNPGGEDPIPTKTNNNRE
ncbi:Putative membrane protein insertion efficiency factor [Serratia symbiotica]|nr:Putative membrane protein insertion efficiency factor [Serratia symbiotica]